MCQSQPTDLAARIAQAVRTRNILQLHDDERPADLAAAEAVLFDVMARLQMPPVAWKLGASTFSSRKSQGFDRAWSAPLFQNEVLVSPGDCTSRTDGSLTLEAELVFELGADLPMHGALGTDDAKALVQSVYAGIEVPATRYASIGVHGAPALVADRGAAGLLVIGDASQDWTPAMLDAMQASIATDGETAASGGGQNLVDGPFGALCDHLRRMQAHGIAQPAGTLVSIGALAGCVVRSPCTAIAIFEGLGSVTLRIAGPGT